MPTVSFRSSGCGRFLPLAASKCAIFVCLLFPVAASAAELIGTVTLLEGSASLLRGPSQFHLLLAEQLSSEDDKERFLKAVGER